MRAAVFAACVAAASASLPKSEDTFLAQQAAIAAVREAENGATTGTQQREAVAVAVAATETIKRSTADVTPRIIEKASSKAERTYTKLVAAGVNQRTAAEQAAEVAVAVVDAVLDEDMSMKIVQDAEAASVVAAKAVSDHPTSVAQAVAQARAGANGVVTAESVAANAARSAVMTAAGGGASQSKEATEGIAAADAAINAVGVGHAVPEDQAKRAEAEAASVFESLVDKQVPEHIAARDAAQTAVNDVDASAPALVKQAAEAASEAAADALSSNEDPLKAAEQASDEAARTVFDEKVASMAAVEAVTGEEGVSSTGSVEDRQASAAAEAAVSVIETAANVPEAVAEKAEKDAAAAYKGVQDGGGASTKTAAEKAVEAAMADLPSTLSAETGSVAAAAAAAAAQAVGENPKDEALALEEASKDASSAVSVEELVSDAQQVSTGGHSLRTVLTMVPLLGLSYAAYHIYTRPKDQEADPYLEGFKPMDNQFGNMELRDRP